MRPLTSQEVDVIRARAVDMRRHARYARVLLAHSQQLLQQSRARLKVQSLPSQEGTAD